jgi:hypothetical protein
MGNPIKNANFKNSPITTLLGLILTLVGVALYVIPYFYAIKTEEVNVWVPAGIGAVGLLLLLSPDELTNIIKKKAE